MTAISFRSSVLPWALASDDEEHFRKLFLALLGLVIVFGIALRFITLPEPDRVPTTTLPPIAAKLLLDKPPAPPPPPPPKARLYCTPPWESVESTRYFWAFLMAVLGTMMPALRAARRPWTWVMVTEPSSKLLPSLAET